RSPALGASFGFWAGCACHRGGGAAPTGLDLTLCVAAPPRGELWLLGRLRLPSRRGRRSYGTGPYAVRRSPALGASFGFWAGCACHRGGGAAPAGLDCTLCVGAPPRGELWFLGRLRLPSRRGRRSHISFAGS